MKRRTLLIGGGAAVLAGGAVAASFATTGSQADYAHAMETLRVPLDDGPDINGVIRYATLAANGHNTQPWRFRTSGQSIRISPDFSRRTPVVDPDDHHLYASLGCAAENMALAAAACGLIGDPRFDPTGDGAVVFDYAVGARQSSPLCDAIPKRQSTRSPFDGRATPAPDVALLAQAAQRPGVTPFIITERAQIDRVRDLVIAANTAQMADKAFVAELKAWLRFNPNTALQRGDGLFSASSGNPTLPNWLAGPMFDLAFTAGAENRKYAAQLDTSAGIAVFVADHADPAGWFAVGRACQRFALQATALGLKCSFVNQPVEVASFRPELASLVGMPGRRPDIVMRFGYGSDLPMSPRRPVATVIDA